MGGFCFLAALFGGIYWVVRYLSDKSAHQKAKNEYDRIHMDDVVRKARWETLVIDKELEAELEDKIYHRDSEVMSELEASCGDYYDVAMPALGIDRLTALRILMANRGHLTRDDAVNGIKIIAHGATTVQMVESHKIQAKFVTQINEKLKKRGIDNPMYFEGLNYRLYPFPGEYNIFSGSVASIGKVKWRPMISTFALQDSNRRLREIGYLK